MRRIVGLDMPPYPLPGDVRKMLLDQKKKMDTAAKMEKKQQATMLASSAPKKSLEVKLGKKPKLPSFKFEQ